MSIVGLRDATVIRFLACLSIVALVVVAGDVERVSAASPEADLSLTKTVDNQVPAVGQDVTFTLTVTNGGPDPASNVRVTDVLPAGLAYVTDDGGGAYASATGVWDAGALDSSGSASAATLQIVATVTGTTAVDNYAEVTASDQADPNSTVGNSSTTEDDDDTVTVTGQPSADLSLTKTVDNPNPVIGEQVTFTLTVANSGSEDASVVQVTDLLPGGLVFVSNSAGSYNNATGVWDASPLASGDHRTLDIVATVTSSTSVDNAAEVTAVTAPAADPDSTPGNASTSEDDDASATVTPSSPTGTIIVNSGADPGDGVADATETTLREAIALAESGPEDTIHFAIGPGATQTIILDAASGPMEVIDSRIVIDGTTEGPGASGRIAIDGGNVASGNGLTIVAGNSTIRGLAIINFPSHGIRIDGDGSNIVAGNYLGVALDGVTGAGNGLDGLHIADTLGSPVGVVNNQIGGINAVDRNVIAGNGDHGINIHGDGWNVVRSNYIGVDATGGTALGNADGGILIRSSSNDIGGSTSFDDCRPCNVISGNGSSGISLAGNNNVVHGNFIGTDASGEGDVPNQGEGIVVGSILLTTSGTTIGVDGPGLARNVISGNVGHGILVVGSSTTMTTIRGNNIGRTASDFPGNNGGDGVHVALADDTTIEFNQIGGSAGDAVTVEGPGSPHAVIRGNVINHNGDLGIDLGADGVTANDADADDDADAGPNSLQNFPDIVSAIATNMPGLPGNTITIDFGLQTNANTTGIVLEFFESAECNPGGPGSPPFGEGFSLIGSLTVDTDSDGSYPASGTDSIVLSRFVPAGFVITATATGPNGTSEFSRCVVVQESTAASAELKIDDVTLAEGDSGTAQATFTVTLTTPSTETITVGYETEDGTADSATDYTSAFGTLTFDPGDTSEQLTIDVLADLLDEPDETFSVRLSNPSNATIVDDLGLATILDDDPEPTVSIDDVTVTEGDSGTTTAGFTVSLSAPSGKSVTVDYATADGTASAGDDYLATAGALTFTPGDTSEPITVDVIGDMTFEDDETFRVDLFGADAAIADASGVASIINDDPAASADLAITVAADHDATTNPVGAGQRLVFTVTATNLGPTDAHDVRVADALPRTSTPDDAAYCEVVAPATSCDTTAGEAYASPNGIPPIATLSAAGSRTFQVGYTVDPATPSGVIANTGSVSSTTFDPNAANDSATVSVRVDARPVASFTFSPGAPLAGSTVTFDGTGSTDDAEITGYAWAFGDGATGAGSIATHVFDFSGSYTVRLTVTDAVGGTSTTTRTVVVTDDPPPPAGRVLRGTITRLLPVGPGGTGPTSEPLAGARVRIGNGPESIRETVTDAQGAYVFANLASCPGGGCVLRVLEPGASTELVDRRVTLGSSQSTTTLDLQTGTRRDQLVLSGRVLAPPTLPAQQPTIAIRVYGGSTLLFDSAVELGGPGGFGDYQLLLGQAGAGKYGGTLRVVLVENGSEIGSVNVTVPALTGSVVRVTAADLQAR